MVIVTFKAEITVYGGRPPRFYFSAIQFEIIVFQVISRTDNFNKIINQSDKLYIYYWFIFII
jgi:hypothetical protein